MTYSNREKTATITVYATKMPRWTSKILAQFTKQGYTLTQANTIDDLFVKWHDGQFPDAVITLKTADSLRFSNALDARNSVEYRPLLIRFSDALATDLPDEHADVILPRMPKSSEPQLQALLDLHQANRVLRKKLQAQEEETKRITNELERQKRLGFEIEILKNAIVRNVSHELRTPLLHVKSAVALIAEDVDNQELVNYAKGATGRLEILVKNITLLGSSLDVNPGPVIVRESVAYAKRNLGRIWEHRNDVERIKIDLDSDLPPVLVDKQGLSTILQLLLDNALKFSTDPIEVTAQRNDDQVRISVIDRGIGIAADHLEAIFDIFYQIDPSSTRKYGGTGVGLAIVRLILDRHNTWIEVDSELGKGSTFSFVLPVIKI